MHLRELLPREHIVAPLEAAGLHDGLHALVGRLRDAGAIARPEALEPLLEPDTELRGAVAIGPDVALPHFRTDAVDGLVLGIGVSPRPLDPTGTGLDIRPRIVALILAPADTAGMYLQTVSTLARFFRDEATTRRLVAARSPDEVLDIADAADLRIQPALTVRDLMTRGAPSLPPDAPLRDAIRLMVRDRAPLVPVVGDNGEVLGTVTDRDVMRALFPQMPRAGAEDIPAERRELQRVTVRDVMTRSVLCVSEDMGLEQVAAMLVNKDVPQLPVVNEGKLTGLLGRGDVIRKLFSA